MNTRGPDNTKSEELRLRLLTLGMLVAFAALGVALWQIQVVDAPRYRSTLDQQSIRRVRLPAVRGRILDRNGIVLADTRPSYCIGLYIEEMRQPGRWDATIDEVERIMARIADILEQEPVITRSDIAAHIKRRLPLPLLAWKDLDEQALARWAEGDIHAPGVDICVEPVRVYPLHDVMPHVVGYVGRAGPTETDVPYHYYLPEMVGKEGVERALNTTLAGAPGGRLIRVDASGFKHHERGERDPVPGTDVTLTIDVGVQQLVEQSLRGQRGAAVVLDPRDGKVVAMASAPGFDLSEFAPRLSPAAWRRLNTGTDRPLFNRALSGVYPPGSTFKPLVAIAGLESGQLTNSETGECPGYFEIGGARFRCWLHTGHGPVAVRKALEQSCNAFFCEKAVAMGYDRIFHMAAAAGFGSRSGIVLRGESAGLLPDNAWKSRVLGDGWRAGDTCNVSIGQGALLVTPLQMAVFVASIANGGKVLHPQLIAGRGLIGGRVVNDLSWSPHVLREVRGGMYDVVQAETGTGKRARLPYVEMAGKTGTAEYGPRSARRKQTWMILYAPYDEPRYAVSMLIEDGISGGITVAPRMRELMDRIFTLERVRAGGGRGV